MQPKPSNQALAGIRVLVVDDIEDCRLYTKLILKRAGASVLACSSGEEALMTLADFNPHVIVSDISMPGLDGHDFLAAVRDLALNLGRPEYPAIAVTAALDEERVWASGFEVCFKKPFDAAHLISEIVRLAGPLS